MVRKSRTIEQRIADLEQEKRSLIARQRKKDDAKDTRRKVLIGTMVLEQISEEGDEDSDQLRNWLERDLTKFLTRKPDRQLFDDIIPQK